MRFFERKKPPPATVDDRIRPTAFSFLLQSEIMAVVNERLGWGLGRINPIVEELCSDPALFGMGWDERFALITDALDRAGCPKAPPLKEQE
jgi:hypothetical protein